MNRVIPDIKLRLKDLRIAVISDRNANGSLAEALINHTSTKIIIRHNIKSAIVFNPITPKQIRS